MLLWGEGADPDGPIAERTPEERVVFHADVLSATALLLSRWEESAEAGVRPGDLDEHGRFPATRSLAFRQGFLDRPLVDDYALWLRAWIRALRPAWLPPPPGTHIALSCDVDHLRDVASPRVALRTLGHHLLRRPDARASARHARRVLRQVVAPRRAQAYTGVLRLADWAQSWACPRCIATSWPPAAGRGMPTTPSKSEG